MRNRQKTVSPQTRASIDDKAQDVEVPKDKAPEEQDPPEQDTEQQDTMSDDWLDDLTPYQDEQSAQAAPQPNPEPETQETPEDGTEEQKRNLAALYKELEFVDEESAVEVHTKIVEPIVSSLRSEIKELRKQRELEQQARMNDTLSRTNEVILAKHKQAKKILGSREFVDYVNSGTNRYARETEFDILMRAYYNGDAEYVLEKIDGFVKSRGKPKPPVGAEPQQGGMQSGVSSVRKDKVMSEAEYLAKRKAIRSAPRGTYPPNALAKLVDEYRNSRGTNG